MGYCREVKYFKRISNTVFEPHSCTKTERSYIMKHRGEAWCEFCHAVVSLEAAWDARGGYDRCPFCGEEPEP